jgi:hypothetical protein
MRRGHLRFERLDRIHERPLLDLAEEFRDEGDDRFDGLLEDPDSYFDLADRFENDRDLPPDRVLLTTEVSNIGSTRVIERAGAIPDENSISPRTGNQMRRFWIDL